MCVFIQLHITAQSGPVTSHSMLLALVLLRVSLCVSRETGHVVAASAFDAKAMWCSTVSDLTLRTPNTHLPQGVNSLAPEVVAATPHPTISPLPTRALSTSCFETHAQIWLYDGSTGAPLSTIGSAPDAHTGSIYSLAWSPDASTIATSSADKTVRLYDAASGACAETWTVSDKPGVGDMQVAVAFCGNQAVSVSLNGNINVLDRGSARPRVVYQAHQGAITAMTPTPVGMPGGGGVKIVTGSFTGVLCAWDPASGMAIRCTGGKADPVTGACHGNKVSGIAACSAGLVSVGWDDTLRLAPAGGDSKDGAPVFTESVGTTGQPCGVAATVDSDLVAVATNKGVTLLRGVAPGTVLSTPYTPTSIAMAPGAGVIAVGSKEGTIHVYETAGDDLRENRVIEGHRGEVTSVAFSPDGYFLAAGDSAREVMVWRAAGDWAAEVRGLWQFHTARVTCLAWSPSGAYLASGGLDENLFVWSPAKPRRRVHYTFANKDGLEGLAWLSDGVVASAGGDHSVATWDVAKDVGIFET